jgi:hypothetical protein
VGEPIGRALDEPAIFTPEGGGPVRDQSLSANAIPTLVSPACTVATRYVIVVPVLPDTSLPLLCTLPLHSLCPPHRTRCPACAALLPCADSDEASQRFRQCRQVCSCRPWPPPPIGPERRRSPVNVVPRLRAHPLHLSSSTPAAIPSSFCPSAFTSYRYTGHRIASDLHRPVPGCPVTAIRCRASAGHSLCRNSSIACRNRPQHSFTNITPAIDLAPY